MALQQNVNKNEGIKVISETASHSSDILQFNNFPDSILHSNTFKLIALVRPTWRALNNHNSLSMASLKQVSG